MPFRLVFSCEFLRKFLNADDLVMFYRHIWLVSRRTFQIHHSWKNSTPSGTLAFFQEKGWYRRSQGLWVEPTSWNRWRWRGVMGGYLESFCLHRYYSTSQGIKFYWVKFLLFFISRINELIEKIFFLYSQASIDSIIFFSDLHPEGLSESLRVLPATTTQLGLIAASTHFISGRPVTLYRDGSFFGEGAVGIALLRQTNEEKKRVSSHLDFLGIRKLSGPLTVTRWAKIPRLFAIF